MSTLLRLAVLAALAPWPITVLIRLLESIP